MSRPDDMPPDPLATPPAPSIFAALTAPANLLSALKWGAIVGVAYYAVGLGLSLLSNALAANGSDFTKNPVIVLPACLGVALPAVAIYVAGYMPGLERGRISPGILGAAITIIVARVLQAIYYPNSGGPTPASSLGVQIVALVLVLAIGLGLGYLGAFYGVKTSARQLALRLDREQ